MKTIIQLLLAALLTCIHITVNATDLSNFSLEELLEVDIVSSATKMALKVNESPSAIRVITAQDIRRFGWRTLGDALATLPGITHVDDRTYDYLGTRGLLMSGSFNSRHIMLIDGTPMNDPTYGASPIEDTFPLDMALIDRIEYVPGTSSAVYGDHAMLGVINITTKSAHGLHGNQLSASMDSVGRQSLRATTAQQFNNGAALTLSVTGQHQRGRDETFPDAVTYGITDRNGNPTLDGVAHGLDRNRNNQLYAKVEKDGLKLSLMYADRVNKPSTAIFRAIFDDDAVKVRDRNLIFNASYSREISQNVDLYTNLNYHNYRYDGTSPYSYTEPLPAPHFVRYEAIEIDDTKRWYAEAHINIRNWNNHASLIGIDLAKDIKNLNSYIETSQLIYSNNLDAQEGLYLQDAWKFTENWQLNSGIRFDHSADTGNHISHRLGLIWQTTPTLTFKALTGRAFRTKRQYDHVDDTVETDQYLDNPNLQAENMLSHELILEWRKNNQFELASSLYHNTLSKIIGPDTASSDIRDQNTYLIRTVGLETSALYHFANQWKLNTSLALQHSERGDGSRLDNSANWITKLVVDGPVWQDKLFAAWELHANGATQEDWHNSITDNTVKVRTGTSVVSNLALTVPNALPNLEMQLRINNLFDRDYTTPSAAKTPFAHIPAYGRNAMIRLTYDF